VELEADAGWNRGRAVELPGSFPTGTYGFRATTRRNFREGPFGRFDRERAPAPEATIEI